LLAFVNATRGVPANPAELIDTYLGRTIVELALSEYPSIAVCGGRWYATRSVNLYTIATSTWRSLGVLTTPRSMPSAAFAANRLHVFGGQWSDGTPIGTTEQYSADTNTWRLVADRPVALARSATAVVDDRIYLIGGVGRQGYTNRCDVYDPAADTWRAVPAYPNSIFPVDEHVVPLAVAIGRVIYAVGSGRNWTRAAAFDTAAGIWTRLPDPPGLFDAVALTIGTGGNSVRVATNWSQPEWSFDRVNSQWVKGGPVYELASNTAATFVGGHLYCISDGAMAIYSDGPEPRLLASPYYLPAVAVPVMF
jgi:hypothetical protein